MSIFDKTDPKRDTEELQYANIEKELETFLKEWDRRVGTIPDFDPDSEVYVYDPSRTKTIMETGKLVLQYVWTKLGLNTPKGERRLVDNNCNLLNFNKND